MSQTKTDQRTEKVVALRFPTKPEIQDHIVNNPETDPAYYGLESKDIDEKTKDEIRTNLAAALAVREVGDSNVPAVYRGTRRCVAFVKGKRCDCVPVGGSFACSLHTDAITYAECQRRLLFLVEPALQCLFEICTSPFSRDDSRIRAAKTILDRTIPVRTEQDIQVTQKQEKKPLSIAEMKKRVEVCRLQIFALAERKRLVAELEAERENAVDVEVIETKTKEVEKNGDTP